MNLSGLELGLKEDVWENEPNGVDPILVVVWICCLGQTKPKGPRKGICVISYFDLNTIKVSILFHFPISFFYSPSLSRFWAKKVCICEFRSSELEWILDSGHLREYHLHNEGYVLSQESLKSKLVEFEALSHLLHYFWNLHCLDLR